MKLSGQKLLKPYFCSVSSCYLSFFISDFRLLLSFRSKRRITTYNIDKERKKEKKKGEKGQKGREIERERERLRERERERERD